MKDTNAKFVSPFSKDEEEATLDSLAALSGSGNDDPDPPAGALPSRADGANKLANPGPLGLLGFGMTTVLLNLHNSGIIELTVMIVAMGFALGGLAQIIAGIFELRQGNTFGGTAFTAYGLFWWSLIFIWIMPFEELYEADEMSMACYLALWGVFTLFMFIASLRHDPPTRVVFLTLAILFFGLAAAEFTGMEIVRTFSGYVGVFCGGAAIFASMRQVLLEEFAKKA